MSYNIPEKLRFKETHEWVEDLGNNTYKIGISDYASQHIGDVTFVELPEVDASVDAGETECVVETVKSSEDIFFPISGTIAAVNEELEDVPENVNDDCYGEGWLFEIKSEDRKAFDELMSSTEYTEFLKEQE